MIQDICDVDDDDGIPYGKACCGIHIGKTSEIQNGYAGVFQNVQDDIGIQYANDGRMILNGNGYEFLGVFGVGESGDKSVHYSGVNLCGTLDYFGDVGGQTLCGVEVWLHNGNDSGGIVNDHGCDKIQSVYYWANLDGNTDGAL